MEDHIRKNDEEILKLREDFLAHLPIENNRFLELKKILLDQNDEMKKLREEIKPVVDAYSTANKMGTFVEWLSKKILAIGIIAGIIITALHYK